MLIGNNIDILNATETEMDLSFPNSQFMIEKFSTPYRLERNRFEGAVKVYVREYISSKQLGKYKFPDDIEGIFIGINLRKVKWLIFGRYRPPSQPVEY